MLFSLYQLCNIIASEEKQMEINILAATSPYRLNVKNEFNKLSGEFAGICYMSGTLQEIIAQPLEKKLARAQKAKENGHHSIFDHECITLYLKDVPKLFAMLLNNEKVYATSEKSARYTQMEADGIDYVMYTKWQKVLEDLIQTKYGANPFFTQKKIQKLAQENARYFLSVFTNTSLAYTTTYRQLSYLYGWLKDIQNHPSALIQKLKPTADQFCKYLEINNFVDKTISQGSKQSGFSLIADKDKQDYYGDVYCTHYFGSLAQFAQAQRHRSLSLQFKEMPTTSFYVPKILQDEPELKNQWLSDMFKIKDLTPQGMIVQIFERGTPEALVMKIKDRLCTNAQLEICQQTKKTLQTYIEQTKDQQIKDMLMQYNNGARCKSGFDCKSPCGFADGINLNRNI